MIKAEEHPLHELGNLAELGLRLGTRNACKIM
jgi:hypothetical protein